MGFMLGDRVVGKSQTFAIQMRAGMGPSQSAVFRRGTCVSVDSAGRAVLARTDNTELHAAKQPTAAKIILT